MRNRLLSRQPTKTLPSSFLLLSAWRRDYFPGEPPHPGCLQSKQMSHLEDQFEIQIKALGLPEFVREYRFSPPRKFRADFAWPQFNLIVEVEGGNWNGGRHTRGKGFESDCEKYNLAVMSGWRVLRGTAKHIKDASLALQAENLIKRSIYEDMNK